MGDLDPWCGAAAGVGRHDTEPDRLGGRWPPCVRARLKSAGRSVATNCQIEAFEALIAAAIKRPKMTNFPSVECDGMSLTPEDLCAQLERDSEMIPDHVVGQLRTLGCVGIAAGKSSFA